MTTNTTNDARNFARLSANDALDRVHDAIANAEMTILHATRADAQLGDDAPLGIGRAIADAEKALTLLRSARERLTSFATR